MSLRPAFESIGGRITVSDEELSERLKKIKAIVFDWDGVFNDGEKDLARGSTFSEVDSMGVNLLRFSRWMETGEIPYSAVMSGASNEIAHHWVQREHFHSIATGAVNKWQAYEVFRDRHGLQDEEVIFFFDDVLDLTIASKVGISIALGRPTSPLFNLYVENNIPVTYYTGNPGGQHGVREACELLIGYSGNADKTFTKRAAFDSDYERYLLDRSRIRAQTIKV